MKQYFERIAALTPGGPKQIEAAVISIVIGLLMMASGVLLLL